jgi:nitric oxide reductase activation protein
LPLTVRALIDAKTAARGDSPAASLAIANSRDAVAEPPDAFGTIRIRPLLAASARALRAERIEIESEVEDADTADAADALSSGRGGALGRWLQHWLTPVRLEGSGPPGADALLHRGRAVTRGSVATLSSAAAGTLEETSAGSRGPKYPEWDVRLRRYRADWCTVQELLPPPRAEAPLALPDRHGLRRALARLGTGLDCCHRQAQGDDLDLDAAVEARADARAGAAPEDAVYLAGLRRRRDLSVLLLLDVSGSAAEPGASGETVHAHQRAAAAALAVALHDLGDRVALYAFQSRGRAAVQVVPVKRFDDAIDAVQRLQSLVPAAYSRLGAAIRHGAAVLEERGATSRRLLVVLSDGLAYDHGYEPAYGAADAQRALAEARRRGTACLCLSIGASADGDSLRRVFGSAAHAALPGPDRLRRVIGPLFRSALRSAEVRRR